MTENKHTDTGASQPSSELEQLRTRVAYLEARLVKAGANWGEMMTPGVAAILSERIRQRLQEGWTPEHDDEHDDGTLAAAAAAYALNAADQLNPYSQGDGGNSQPIMWPWAAEWWKPSTVKRDLEKAGALIAAEWECLDRAERRQAEEPRS